MSSHIVMCQDGQIEVSRPLQKNDIHSNFQKRDHIIDRSDPDYGLTKIQLCFFEPSLYLENLSKIAQEANYRQASGQGREFVTWQIINFCKFMCKDYDLVPYLTHRNTTFASRLFGAHNLSDKKYSRVKINDNNREIIEYLTMQKTHGYQGSWTPQHKPPPLDDSPFDDQTVEFLFDLVHTMMRDESYIVF